VEVVFREHGVHYDVVLEAGGWEVIKEYVQAGLGVSIVTSICLRGDEPLTAVPLDAYFPRHSYGLILRRGKTLSPAARRFVEILARHGNLEPAAESLTIAASP
jgi:DNA-binding transcriptional LysR family regulator